MAEIPPYPLYNRSYLLYRLSPLHTPDASLLTPSSLKTHAQRLTSQLKGDSLRNFDLGINVDPEGSTLASLGPLEHCSWDSLGDEDAWITQHRHLVDADTSLVSTQQGTQIRGVQVTLDYEKTSYNALLLCDPDHITSPPSFTSLPLLMLKMPAPIREIFLNYLATAFDTRHAPLDLSSSFLTSTLETYLRRLTTPNSPQTVKSIVNEVSLQLSFDSPSLSHIDVTLAADDIPKFLDRGKHINPDTPFTAALSLYLKSHMALDVSHPGVNISRLSCAAFNLGNDRIRFSVPEATEISMMSSSETENSDLSPAQLAFQDVYAALVREAAGKGMFLTTGEDARGTGSSTPSAEAAGGARRGMARRGRPRSVARGT
ncbi:hypothetical protein M011DRAFT_467452 [Sporormia fimetaria CBS 119925]|uniref:Kinetochore complex Sim4 subunit Fta1-domain-containing protein n=1 Tax=Sporormia fimetaria CBS 119925 TaxID=1340428 RepID=A0A6A6VB83_9PLEO|nr:hypothetical protein M011DRAFT_467452 [Sporormia fimetaria CBS 119925]